MSFSFFSNRLLSVLMIYASGLLHSVENPICTDLKGYFEVIDKHSVFLGPSGNWREGEIEILHEMDQIIEAEMKTGRKVGIVAQDCYWMWLNDAVRFPSGSYGVYGRFMWMQALEGIPGVAVMCRLPDGKIVLNCNYRHATRAWELELPRGCASSGELAEDTAKREVLEETGMVVDQVISLGEIACDTGVTNTVVPIFLAKVVGKEEAVPEDSEAIAGIVAFDLKELFEGIKKGELSVEVNGKQRIAKLRDPFLTYALLQAQIRELL